MPSPVLTAVQKVLAIVGGRRTEYSPVTTGGPANAYQIGALGPGGRFDITMMAEGVGPSTDQVMFTETVAAGRFVNVYNSGTEAAPAFSARNADGSTSGKEANGFVLTAQTAGQSGTVYGSGANTALTGLKPGRVFLSGTVPGGVDVKPPEATGSTYQELGSVTSAGVLMVNLGEPITRG